MSFFPIFLSVVFVLRNQSAQIQTIVSDTIDYLSPLVSDYEIIIVDNASDDESLLELKKITGISGLPNVQVYALTKEVDADMASWVGLENALGDFVAVVDPVKEDINFLEQMLSKAAYGTDVIFANNEKKPKESVLYKLANAVFNQIYFFFNGISLINDAPQYRVLSKKVVNLILRHPQPALTYRHLPATGGFTRANLTYSSQPKISGSKKNLWESIDRGMRLLVSTARGPMRLVTILSFFGAITNAIYSIYVVGIGLFKADVAPGWTSLSLQLSGMFLLISLVLLVLGEYILQMASLSNQGPGYTIAQEFTSSLMTRYKKLNIEENSIAQSEINHTSAK